MALFEQIAKYSAHQYFYLYVITTSEKTFVAVMRVCIN